MRRATWSLLVLAMTLLLLAPAAQACTRLPTDDPDDHARLQVHDVLANKTLASLRLEHRSMDNMCALKNARDIDGDHVAWSESHDREQADDTTVRAHDLETNETRVVHRLEARDTVALAVHDGHVVHVSRFPNGTMDSGEPAYRLVVFMIDLDADAVHERDVEPSGDVRVGGPWIAWTEDDAEGDARTLHLYDAVAGEWADEPLFPWDDPAIPFETIGLPSNAQLALVGGDWLVFTTRDGVWVHHARDRETFDVSDRLEDNDRMVLADGYLWQWSYPRPPFRFAVPHGEPETLDPSWKGYYDVVIDDGRALTGDYSTGAPRSLDDMRENDTRTADDHPGDPSPDGTQPSATEVVPTTPMLSVLALLALLAHRRRP